MSLDYVIVRSHGLLQHLLKRGDYEQLITGDKKICDFIEYSQVREEYPLERKLSMITERFISRIKFLQRISDEKMVNFYQAFLDFLELENIKFKLRHIYGRYDRERYHPYSHFIDLEVLKRIKKEKNLIEILAGTPYEMNEEVSKRLGSILEKEAYLEALYYRYFRGTINQYKSLRILSKYINYEVIRRLTYWVIVLGEKKAKELLRNNVLDGLLPYGVMRKFNIGKNNIDIKLLLEFFKLDEEGLRLIRGKKISGLMKLIRVKELNMLKEGARNMSLTIIYVYYYMQLCKEEMYNLHKILLGKEIGLPEDVILDAIIISL